MQLLLPHFDLKFQEHTPHQGDHYHLAVEYDVVSSLFFCLCTFLHSVKPAPGTVYVRNLVRKCKSYWDWPQMWTLHQEADL
eukprot:11393243-Ditylum_brightwellii.AAC.1